MSLKAKIGKVYLQAGTESTVYVTWKWKTPKTKRNGGHTSSTKEYKYEWQYKAGNTWFAGDSGSTKAKIITYNAPTNASNVRVRVKPIPNEYTYTDSKKKKHKGTSWSAGWSKYSYRSLSKYVTTPDTPSVSIYENNKYQLLVEVIDDDPSNKKIQFEVTRVSGTYSSIIATPTVNKSNNRAAEIVGISAGFEYMARCRSINGSHISDWSDYSSTVTTIPSAPGKPTGAAISSTSIQVSWSSVSYAKSYSLEYATDVNYFNGSTNTQKIDGLTGTSKVIDGLDTGKTWYFRIKAVNDAGESEYSPISNGVVLGKKPDAPTTWSLTTKASITDKTVVLYWVHNSEDGSSQTSAEISITANGSTEVKTWINNRGEDDKDKTVRYVLDISSYPDATKIKWKVRTKGLINQWSPWSVEREIDIYAPPVLSADIPSLVEAENSENRLLTAFPFTLKLDLGSTNQNVLSYHISIVSDQTYRATDDDDIPGYLVHSGEEIYTTDVDVEDGTEKIIDVVFTPAIISLINNLSYTINCSVAMDSGLSADASVSFTTAFESLSFYPIMEHTYDEDAKTASILAYCIDFNPEADDTDDTKPDETEDDTEDILTQNVTLAVYRKNFDGTYTELASGIPNDKCHWVLDPHPSMNVGCYRIIATSTITGQSEYGDYEEEDIGGETGVIIQWNEYYDNPTYDEEEDAFNGEVANHWAASFLHLIYNIDISDNNSLDVSLVKYIGRSHPVSYYGTQIGQTATWSAAIPKTDTETLLLLRELSVWMGDCYVRESSGSGYWANVGVSFSQSHDQLTIPISLTVTRVEGGK